MTPRTVGKPWIARTMHPPTPRFALLRSVIIGVIALVAPLSAGRAQQLDPDQWGANGTVSAMAASGDTVFLGGDFSLIGPVSGGGGELSLRDGRPTPNFPRVTGTIRAALPDGQGGWFVGGTFSALEGVPHANLAHVLADGRVAAWDPNVVGVPGRVIAYPIDRSNQIEVVSALVRDGNLLYVGGTFSQVAGQPRPGLAAVDVHTGRLESWAPDPDGVVTSLAIERRRLYVGGSFTHVAGAARARLAAFELRSGTLTRWNPGASDAVFCLEATDKVVFVGGDFDSVGGRARNSLAAIDPVTGAVAEWDARLGPRRQVLPQLNFVWPWVGALAIQDHRLVVGGFFESFGGTPRHDLAMLDQGTADPTPFDPEPDGYIYSLFVQGPELLVGGEFNHIGGATQPFAAELRLPGGEATAWSPTLGGPAFLVRPAARDVLVGGAFAQIQPWAHRHGLAALDAPTGRLLDWDPETDGYVLTLLIDGGRLFAGGNFGLVAGQPRHHLASFATGTGALEDWVPGVSEVVRTLAARGPSISWAVIFTASTDN